MTEYVWSLVWNQPYLYFSPLNWGFVLGWYFGPHTPGSAVEIDLPLSPGLMSAMLKTVYATAAIWGPVHEACVLALCTHHHPFPYSCFLLGSLDLGLYLAEFRDYAWLCAQGLLVMGLRHEVEPYGRPGIDPGWLMACKAVPLNDCVFQSHDWNSHSPLFGVIQHCWVSSHPLLCGGQLPRGGAGTELLGSRVGHAGSCRELAGSCGRGRRCNSEEQTGSHCSRTGLVDRTLGKRWL